MRKYFFGLFVSVLGLVLLTGCGGSDSKKVTCTADLKEGDTKYGTGEIVATLDDSDKVSKVKVTMKIDDKDAAQQVFAMLTLANSFAEKDSDKIDAKLDGSTITIENAESYFKQSGEGTSVVGMTKEEFIKQMQESVDSSVVCK